MWIIEIKYQGKVYHRKITRKQGFYVMESKGVEYWFGKDIHHRGGINKGWQIVNSKTLPEHLMPLITDELERLFGDNFKSVT